MRKTLKYKLYNNKKNSQIDALIDLSAEIWNHCIALHRRYFRLTGKFINVNALMKHVAKLKKLPRFQHWNGLGSQAIQDICQRIDRAYQLFFKSKKGDISQDFGRPSFCNRKKYKSFTLKQAGWKLLGPNKIRIGSTVFKFFKSRNIVGDIKTVTVKRDSVGDLYVCFSVELEDPEVQVTTGKSVGLDFGMKQFLTLSDGTAVQSPLFFREYQNDIKRLNRELSRKKLRSNHRKQAKIALAKLHRTIAEKRRDFFFKLAHDLTNRFDFLFFEDLNMKGMQRRWGKKISDLAFSEFINILEYVAKLKGKTVHFIDRFYPSSKTCSCCGLIKQDLSLKDREWRCEGCDTLHDRDYNASLNIHRVGASTLRLGEVRPSLTAFAA